ncbi:MAG: rhodanese-related sulfurtransferase, partial [Candidatus Peregrinibacteria bacterium]|nr:rhodanese-related sulfurtransferase [Candidatus Peregrinibacteria bacterium]
MYKLANNLSKEEALKKISTETFSRRTLSFYRYVKITDPRNFRDELYREFADLNILGRIYVSQEGINAQMNVPEPQWDAFIACLESRVELRNMPLKIAVEQAESFWKLTIKVKRQIVADGLPIDTYDIENVGTHLNAEEFNALASDADTLVVDMRNAYESEIGRFEGAFCPDVDTFNDALPAVKEALSSQKDKKLLLYCTGGIRCEKASAYLKNEGFENVYQLYGGIINYAHEVRAKNLPSKFKGKNFVFDERRAERITEDVVSKCHQCDAPADTHANCANEMCNLLFIQCENCQTKMSTCCSEKCQVIFALPETERRKLRKHQKTKPKMFNRQGLAC